MVMTSEDFYNLSKLRSTRVFAAKLEEIAADASFDDYSFEDKIKLCLDAQLEAKATALTEKRLRQAGLKDCAAALENFQAGTSRGVSKDRIARLGTCEWIDLGHDYIVVGASGAGKTYLAQAMAVAACRRGYTARYYRMARLADDFDAVADKPAQRRDLLDSLTQPDLVVIDDFLLTDVSAHALNQVLNLLVGRENSSTVIASQHEPSYWYNAFAEDAISDAVLSRLQSSGAKLTLKGEDMRDRDDIRQERQEHIKALRAKQSRRR